jgi:hypothetical protein
MRLPRRGAPHRKTTASYRYFISINKQSRPLMPAIKPRPTPPDCNTLVKLPALDDGDTVHYDVALIICGIISDNMSGGRSRASHRGLL